MGNSRDNISEWFQNINFSQSILEAITISNFHIMLVSRLIKWMQRHCYQQYMYINTIGYILYDITVWRD